MYNYFNCNVDFLIDHSAMVELEIVPIISRQKEKTLQNQPPNPKDHGQKKKLFGKAYGGVIKIAPSLYSPKLRKYSIIILYN